MMGMDNIVQNISSLQVEKAIANGADIAIGSRFVTEKKAMDHAYAWLNQRLPFLLN